MDWENFRERIREHGEELGLEVSAPDVDAVMQEAFRIIEQQEYYTLRSAWEVYLVEKQTPRLCTDLKTQ